MDYPKVLIIGQPFNRVSGGGITITNLFKLWPKDRLYLATNTHRALKNDFSICPNVYLLGKDEVKIPFLLRFFLRNKNSGVLLDPKEYVNTTKYINPSLIKKTNILYKPLSFIISLLNLKFLFFRINISNQFILWLNEIKPEIIYSQLGHYEFNLFVYKLKKIYNVPLVIHIMDDWPHKCTSGIASRYWQKKMSESFIKVLSITDELITISESMMKEYKLRYGIGEHYFHNPVKIPSVTVKRYIQKPNSLKIGYFGRLGQTNINSIKKTIDVVSRLIIDGYNFSLDIYTPDKYILGSERYSKLINVFNSIPHQDIFNYLTKYDILLLPLDFDSTSIEFIRFSFPTKASEYMASGRLILIFGPKQSSVVLHAIKNKWAVVVDKNDSNYFMNKLLSIYNNIDLFYEYRQNAVKIANKEFSEDKVCSRFLDIFVELNSRNS